MVSLSQSHSKGACWTVFCHGRSEVYERWHVFILIHTSCINYIFLSMLFSYCFFFILCYLYFSWQSMYYLNIINYSFNLKDIMEIRECLGWTSHKNRWSIWCCRSLVLRLNRGKKLKVLTVRKGEREQWGIGGSRRESWGGKERWRSRGERQGAGRRRWGGRGVLIIFQLHGSLNHQLTTNLKDSGQNIPPDQDVTFTMWRLSSIWVYILMDIYSAWIIWQVTYTADS